MTGLEGMLAFCANEPNPFPVRLSVPAETIAQAYPGMRAPYPVLHVVNILGQHREQGLLVVRKRLWLATGTLDEKGRLEALFARSHETDAERVIDPYRHEQAAEASRLVKAYATQRVPGRLAVYGWRNALPFGWGPSPFGRDSALTYLIYLSLPGRTPPPALRSSEGKRYQRWATGYAQALSDEALGFLRAAEAIAAAGRAPRRMSA